jgi:hypothetical protein
MYAFNVNRMFYMVEIINNNITINRKEMICEDAAAEEVIVYNSLAMLNNTFIA